MYENENEEIMQEEQSVTVTETEPEVDSSPNYPVSTEIQEDDSRSGLTMGEVAGAAALIGGGIYVAKKVVIPAGKRLISWLGEKSDERLRKKAAKKGWTIIEKVEEPTPATTPAEAPIEVPEAEIKPAEEKTE